MATTTGGFSKVHTVTSSSAVPKEWMKSLDEGYSTLRQSFKSGKTLTEDWRLGQLQALERMFVNDRDTIAAALAEDLKRPAFEVDNFEIGPTVAEIKFAMRNLRTWMKPESTMTPPLMQLGSSRVERIPKGVVLVMGAWNFPFHLSLTPCIAAIAAGNCVVLKPSDVSPHPLVPSRSCATNTWIRPHSACTLVRWPSLPSCSHGSGTTFSTPAMR